MTSSRTETAEPKAASYETPTDTVRRSDARRRLISVLHRMDRFHVHELRGDARPKGIPDEAGVFALHWRTDDGDDASIMVLGPFGWMPVHRRAPYLLLMSWTGARMNDLLLDSLRQRERPVGFIDMPIEDASLRDKYQMMWETSRGNATRMRNHEGVSVNKAARAEVAFVVSSACAARLRNVLNDQ